MREPIWRTRVRGICVPFWLGGQIVIWSYPREKEAFGYSYNVSRYMFYMLNVEAGVTPDAPNVQITIRFPLYF